MNGAHQALIDVAEQLAQMRADLDQFDVRISDLEHKRGGRALTDEMARVHNRLSLVEMTLELPVKRPGLQGRARAAAALRREGWSIGVIAVRLKAPKSTVHRWLDELGVPTPERVKSTNGRMIRTDLNAEWRDSVNGRPQA